MGLVCGILQTFRTRSCPCNNSAETLLLKLLRGKITVRSVHHHLFSSALVKPHRTHSFPLFSYLSNFVTNCWVTFRSIKIIVQFLDIYIPGTNTVTQSGGRNKIPAGETVLVIKTPRGMYIRTNQVKENYND